MSGVKGELAGVGRAATAFALCAFAGCVVDFSEAAYGGASCGNGVIDPDEQCDGRNVAGFDCGVFGFDGGDLRCRNDCTLDFAGCTGGCGNEAVEQGEACDGADLRGSSCESLGHGPGSLGCLSDCTGFDVSGCTGTATCGNSVREDGETCDGADLAGRTCELLGFVGGTLSCLSNCAGYDTSRCTLPDGSPCERSSGCDGGVCLTEASWGWPGGYCTRSCSLGECTGNDVCVSLGGPTEALCLRPCVTSNDCGFGYACFGFDTQAPALCWPFCETVAHCPGTQFCNRWQGLCGVSPVRLGNGQPCDYDSECESFMCMSVFQPGYRYCVSPCNLQTRVCPQDGVCADAFNGDRADMGICLDGCLEQGDCAETQWQCLTDPWGSGNKVCVPM